MGSLKEEEEKACRNIEPSDKQERHREVRFNNTR